MATDEHDISTDMGMFEAARQSATVELPSVSLGKVLIVTDGSNQDDTALALGNALARAHQAKTSTERKPDANAGDVLKLAEKSQADLIVLPVPFGRDSSSLKHESLGSVIDMLLLEARVPVLCARQPMESSEVESALRKLLIPILDHESGHERAAAWAFHVLSEGGSMELLGVADEDLIAEAKKIFEEALGEEVLRAEALNRATQRDIGPLVATIQKKASEEGINVHVEIRIGRPIEIALERANDDPGLMVVSTVRDDTSIAHHHAVDLVRGSDFPVLVV